MARTIAGVTEDIEAMRFNTAISKLMVCVREITRDEGLYRKEAEEFVLLLAPLAPHLAEELWNRLGHSDSLAYEAWPEANGELLEDDKISIVLQVNGKKRDELQVDKSISEADLKELALASEKVQGHLSGREPKKVIVVPGRLVNIVG